LPRRIGAALLALLVAGACRKPEPLEALRARAQQEFLLRQLAELEARVAKAERSELSTLDQIAIGIEEKVVAELLNAPMPRELVIEKRLRIRLESALPLFRGSQAALVFRARASSEDVPSAHASIELGGTLDAFQLSEGRLTARVKVLHFALLESSVGNLAGAVAEQLIRSNLSLIEAEIPALEIPVQLEPEIRVAGARMGPVTVKPGELPLRITVSDVLPVNRRLWILLDVVTGPWKPLAERPGA
jgi:hypothetical protein